ncbi:MAG: FtsW/RodA/SpoVE family cell cycle protein [Bacteroidales bacterium]|nr:FtsW/RodA/SpoVE family cell cycle protein [Bacteroidales bacterium]
MTAKEAIDLKIKNLFRGDKVIWMIVVFLTLISMLVVYTSSDTLAYREYNDDNGRVLMKHLMMLGLGLVALVIAANINYRYYSRLLLLLFWVSVPLLLYTLFFGKNLNQASRVIGIAGITFQSSDLAKLALVGFLARVLTLKREQLADVKELILSVIVPILLVVGLIFPANFSTAAMLFATCIVMMFLGKVKMKYLFGFVGTIALVGGLAILILLHVTGDNPQKNNRSQTWVNRIERFVGKGEESKNDEKDFQLTQSKIAIAGGGVVGKMPGKSTQRTILPHPYSDFIYAIILEEYGLLGGVFVLLLYLILMFRAVRIMLRAPQSFGALLAMGLAFSLVMQAMVNMGVAVGLLPVTGQPMPFVSRGGTSLLFTGISIGIIISITREIQKNDGNDTEFEVAESTEADS